MRRRTALRYLAVGVATASGCVSRDRSNGDDVGSGTTTVRIRNGLEDRVDVTVSSISDGDRDPLVEGLAVAADSVETVEVGIESGEHTIGVSYDDRDDTGDASVEREGRLEVSMSERSTRIEFVRDVPQ